MNLRQSALAVGAVVLGVVSLVACGSDRTGAVTSPSSAVSTPLSAAAVEPSARSSGAVVSATAETPFNTITSLVAGTSCPTLQFQIGTYLIQTDAATRYEGGSCASLHAGTRLTLHATRLGADSEQTVYASQITIRPDTTPRPTPMPTPVNGEGTVSSIVATTSCPALTFLLGGSYTVVTSASTRWEHGTCATLEVGSKVEVTGTRTGDSSIAATNIEFRGGSPSPTGPTAPTRPGERVEGEGVITSLSGGTACPTLQFTIGPYLITIDASTLFERGACRDLAIGTRIHVKGELTGDGAVLATRISVQSDSPGSPVVEGDGRVSSLVSGTACPALTFLIEEYTVRVTASTTFVGGGCSDVVAGKKLGVKGTVTGDKQVLATQIVFKNGDS